MIDMYDKDGMMNNPDWQSKDQLVVDFIFAGGLKETVVIDTSGSSAEELREIRRQIVGKRKLLQSIFEHGTHGQITVQGLTVRADDLIAMNIQ